MTPSTSFQRKIIYLVVIVGLLIALSFLGRPGSERSDQAGGVSGGWLAAMRVKHGFDQAHLGEMDPTSETLKLATFGLRGVAANVLWGKAHNYKKKKDWTNLRATVNQITKLQPNFVSVWIFHAWNRSHNISWEFDDVGERYHWVIEGIRFLEEGAKHNGREPRLSWETGWVVSNKIGRADEHRQFRRMFKEDDDFHGDLPFDLQDPQDPRDNWLVGKGWFRKAERLAEPLGRMKGKGPLIYRSNAPMCQMSYAEALEKDGVFSEKARLAWKRAEEEWIEYGKVDIPVGPDASIRLGDKERYEKIADQLADQLDRLHPDPEPRKKIRQRKLANLTDEQREALETPLAKRTGRQMRLASQAERELQVSDEEVAREIQGPHRREAVRLTREAVKNRRIAAKIGIDCNTVNYDYWLRRARMEQTDEAIAARDFIHQGDKAFEEGDLPTAKQRYEDGFAQWREVLDKDQFHPMIADPAFGADEMTELIERYARILELRDEPFPEKFILQDIVDLYKEDR